jgi:hypothetical protein
MQDLSPRRIRKRLEDQIHISILSEIPKDSKRDREKRRNCRTARSAKPPHDHATKIRAHHARRFSPGD